MSKTSAPARAVDGFNIYDTAPRKHYQYVPMNSAHMSQITYGTDPDGKPCVAVGARSLVAQKIFEILMENAYAADLTETQLRVFMYLAVRTLGHAWLGAPLSPADIAKVALADTIRAYKPGKVEAGSARSRTSVEERALENAVRNVKAAVKGLIAKGLVWTSTPSIGARNPRTFMQPALPPVLLSALEEHKWWTGVDLFGAATAGEWRVEGASAARAGMLLPRKVTGTDRQTGEVTTWKPRSTKGAPKPKAPPKFKRVSIEEYEAMQARDEAAREIQARAEQERDETARKMQALEAMTRTMLAVNDPAPVPPEASPLRVADPWRNAS